CKTKKSIIAASLILLASRSFMSYTSSGLENSLLFLLCTLFLTVLLMNERYSRKDLFYIALLEGLIAFTRIDAAILFAPVCVYCFLFCRYQKEFSKEHVSFMKSMLFALAGLLPFILWELFSLLYYGFFFPNTAYAK